MNVKCDGFGGQPSVPTSCPNLRSMTSGGFLTKKVSYHCGATGEPIDIAFANNVCKYCRFNHVNNTQYADIKYLECSHYKIYGIRNGR